MPSCLASSLRTLTIGATILATILASNTVGSAAEWDYGQRNTRLPAWSPPPLDSGASRGSAASGTGRFPQSESEALPQEGTRPDAGSGWFPRDMWKHHFQSAAVSYQLLGGSAAASLAGKGSAQGYAVEFTTARGVPIFELLGRARFSYAMGKSELPGATGEVPFSLFGAEGIVGFRSHLIPGEFHRVQPYWGAAGKFAISHLRLSGLEDGSSLKPYTSALLFGAEYFVGAEISGRLLFEIQMRLLSGTLGGVASLEQAGFAFALGWIW